MLEELENKMKIRELVDKFAALEINVHNQMDLFTEDCVVNIYFGDTIGMTMKGKEVEINGDEAKGTLYSQLLYYQKKKEKICWQKII